MEHTMLNYLATGGGNPEAGIELGEIGALSALILLPWTFKIIWAPLMDTFTLRSMGRRRSWIIGAQLLMALTLIGILFVPNVTSDYKLLGIMFFIHNIFASMQDVATDALAVDILPSEEQGRANGMMWASKLLGIGGASLCFAFVIEYAGIEAAVYIQIAILGAVMILPMLWLERPGEKRFPWSPGGESVVKEETYGNPRVLASNILLAFSLRTLLIFLLFTLLHNLGPEIGKFMAKGICANDLQWTHQDLSGAQFLAMGPELFLALAGGFLSQLWGRRTILILGMGAYACLNLLAAAVPSLWANHWFPNTYLILAPGLIAVGSVGFLSMAMRISWTQALGTVFTTYMALSNVSAVLGKKIIGTLEESIGTYSSFFVAAALGILPLLFLPLVTPSQVDQAREKYMEDRNPSKDTPGH
jgi:PAT family beta-lactamase induction signal transducer AmpG